MGKRRKKGLQINNAHPIKFLTGDEMKKEKTRKWGVLLLWSLAVAVIYPKLILDLDKFIIWFDHLFQALTCLMQVSNHLCAFHPSMLLCQNTHSLPMVHLDTYLIFLLPHFLWCSIYHKVQIGIFSLLSVYGLCGSYFIAQNKDVVTVHGRMLYLFSTHAEI